MIAEGPGRLVAVLEFQLGEIDALLSRRGGVPVFSRLKLEPELEQRGGKSAGAVAHASARRVAQADVHQALQERARRNNHGRAR